MRIARKAPADTPLTRYIEARKAAEDASNALKLAEEDLITDLVNRGQKTISHTEGDKVQRATFYSSTSVQIDEEGLKKSIGAKNWGKVSKTVIDRTKLQEAVDTGVLSASAVGAHLTTKQSKPSIRFSEGAKKEDTDG